LIITPHILLTLQVYEVLKTLHVTIITSEWDTALATFTITILLNALGIFLLQELTSI